LHPQDRRACVKDQLQWLGWRAQGALQGVEAEGVDGRIEKLVSFCREIGWCPARIVHGVDGGEMEGVFVVDGQDENAVLGGVGNRGRDGHCRDKMYQRQCLEDHAGCKKPDLAYHPFGERERLERKRKRERERRRMRSSQLRAITNM